MVIFHSYVSSQHHGFSRPRFRTWLSRASRQGNKGLNILAPPSQAALDGALDQFQMESLQGGAP